MLSRRFLGKQIAASFSWPPLLFHSHRCYVEGSDGSHSLLPRAITVAFAPGLPVNRVSENTALRKIPPSSYCSFVATLDGGDFHEQYSSVGMEESEETLVRVAGRIVSIRDMGKMCFLSIRSANVLVQLVAAVGPHYTHDALQAMKRTLRKGDVIGAEGAPRRTRKGELSIFVCSIRVLAPFVSQDLVCCPDQLGHFGPADAELKYRYRFLDMMCNPQCIGIFKRRQCVVAALRQYFESRKFVEVETPMFHRVAGGASAKPFVTRHNANGTDLFLRVAPELYLKQCIVGGMDRVFEIGKVFRNEGCDKEHSPEYTSCEFYMAYATYNELMSMTEEILRMVCTAATGGTTIEVTSARTGEAITIDFAMPFARVPVMPTLEARIGHSLPDPADLNSKAGAAYLKRICIQYGVALPDPMTPAKLLDKLIDHFIVEHIVEPTFVMDHPVFMCPLAKEHDEENGLCERFELYVNGMELCNAYSELNDPVEQLCRFEEQIKVRAQYGDEEAHGVDETFLKALQVGLPPTAGWGLGVDRLVALICGFQSIRDVILFPMLRSDEASHDTKRRVRTASFFGVNQQMTMFCLSALEAELQRRGEVKGCENLRHLRQLASSLCHGFCEQNDALGAEMNRRRFSPFVRLLCRLLFGPPRK